MKAFFSRDSVLKIVSLLVSIILWFYIIIVVDPSVDITIRDIPVRYTNQDILADNELCIVNESKPTVTIKIRGSRKKIASIDEKNVYATVDVSNITKKGKASLPIGLSIPYEYSEIVSKKPYNAELIIDEVSEKEVEITVVKSGNVANGYIAGAAETADKKVKLSGSLSLLDDIGGAAVILNYDNRNAEINDTAKISLIDKAGKTIDNKSYIYEVIEMDISETQIFCPVFKLKTVPVKLDDAAAAELGSHKISIQPSNVTVYGATEILNSVNEIYTESFSVSEVTGEGDGKVQLVIPEGILMRDAVTEVVVKAEPRE